VSALTADIAIIGGGVAGLSLAASLSPLASVVIVETEGAYAHHTSSRSAQQMQPAYGPREIRVLTEWAISLVQGFEQELGRTILTPRPLLVCAFDGDDAPLERSVNETPVLRRLSVDDALEFLPVLRPELLSAAAIDETSKEVEVTSLLGYYAKCAGAAGTRTVFSSPVTAAKRSGAGWTISAGDTEISAGIVVNAAGAWGNDVADLFGKHSPQLTPYRRTVTIATPRGATLDPFGPMLNDSAGTSYFRPHAEGVLASPEEDIESAPTDAQPRLEDIAEVKRRVNRITTLDLGESVRSWTGLRTFAPDGKPVVGFDPDDPSFFWLVGQGGYGIQTSAAIGSLSALEIAGNGPDVSLVVASAFADLHWADARFERQGASA
jgi:D-arginine dehydrogenase